MRPSIPGEDYVSGRLTTRPCMTMGLPVWPAAVMGMVWPMTWAAEVTCWASGGSSGRAVRSEGCAVPEMRSMKGAVMAEPGLLPLWSADRDARALERCRQLLLGRECGGSDACDTVHRPWWRTADSALVASGSVGRAWSTGHISMVAKPAQVGAGAQVTTWLRSHTQLLGLGSEARESVFWRTRQDRSCLPPAGFGDRCGGERLGSALVARATARAIALSTPCLVEQTYPACGSSSDCCVPATGYDTSDDCGVPVA